MAYPVFRQDQKVFVGINTVTISPMPTAPQDLPEQPQHVTRIRWAVDAFPQLPFVLVSPSFHGPLLSPLNVINIVRDEIGFCMAQKNLEKWKNLEKCLLHCAQTLFRSAKKDLPPTPNGFDPVAKKYLPRAYGYTLSYPSREAAESIAERSKEGFNLLFGLVSYGIIRAAGRDDLSTSCAHPQWAKVLHNAKIHPAWVESLQSSPIADFSAKRVGAFIGTHTCQQWRNQIPLMERAGCPLFIQWEAGSYQSVSDTVMRKYQPSPAAFRREFCTSQPAAAPSCESAPPPPIFEHKYARPSGQLNGETMEDFFTRREKSNQKRIEQETPAEKQKRESRAKAAEKHAIPGKSSKAAAVFVWEPDDSGVLIRRAISRGDVEDEFLTFSKEQRRYDAIRNEWDCYLGWAPNAISDEERENAYLYPDEDILPPGPDPPTHPRTPAPLCTSGLTPPTISTPPAASQALVPCVPQHLLAEDIHSTPSATSQPLVPCVPQHLLAEDIHSTPSATSQTLVPFVENTRSTPSATSQPLVPLVPQRLPAEDTRYTDALADMYAPVDEIGEFINEVVFEDLEDALYYRYGFCWEQDGYDPMHHHGATGSPEDIRKVKKCFVHDKGVLRLSSHQPARDFLHGLLARHRREDPFPPVSLWDLSSTNPNRLQLPSALNLSPALRPLSCRLIVRCHETSRRVLYFIESTD
jgi:hypothetical protein